MTVIRPFRSADLAWALDMNTELEVALSALTRCRLAVLVVSAFHARTLGAGQGFLIALDQTAEYDSPNFLWVKARYERFVYLDRVAVAASARRQGLARALYEDLFAAARDTGHDAITCEVNIEPPNPDSHAFHTRLGFTEIGRRELAEGKSVLYLRAAL